MNSTTTEEYTTSKFNIFYTIAALLTASFHVVGLCLMYFIDFKPAIQRIIIMNLALTELMCCLTQAGLYIENLVDAENWGRQPVLSTMYLVAMTFSFTSYKLVMLYLIMDRFSDIFLNLRYALYFDRKRVLKILSSLWICSACYGVIMGICGAIDITSGGLDKLRDLYQIHNIISVSLDGIIMLMAIITYVYFFIIVYKMVKADQALQRVKKLKNIAMKFLLPFLMVANFLTFNVGSTIMFEMAWESEGDTRDKLGRWAMFMLISGFLLDSVLYIFLQRGIRDFLKSKMMRVQRINSTTTIQRGNSTTAIEVIQRGHSTTTIGVTAV